MGLMAVDRLNRKVIGYLCRNDTELAYCCGECDVEFDAAQELESHMVKHERRRIPHGRFKGVEADTTLEINSDSVVELGNDEDKENRLRSKYSITPCSVLLIRLDVNDTNSDSSSSSSSVAKSKSRPQSTCADDALVGNGETVQKPSAPIETKQKPAAPIETVQEVTPPVETNGTQPRKRIKTQPSPESQRKTYKCKNCPMTFRHGGHFRRHIITVHTIEKPFVCFLCGSKFATNDELTQHQQFHQPDSTKSPVFPCSVCGKNVENLKKHLRDHEEEKNVKEQKEEEEEEAISIVLPAPQEVVEQISTNSIDRLNGAEHSNLSNVSDFNGFINELIQNVPDIENQMLDAIVPMEFNEITNDNHDTINNDTPNDIIPSDGTSILNDKPTNGLKQKKVRKPNGLRKNAGQFTCQVCNKHFQLELLLIQHMMRHDRPRFPCRICGKLLTKSYSRVHLQRYHRPTVGSAEPSSQDDEQIS